MEKLSDEQLLNLLKKQQINKTTQNDSYLFCNSKECLGKEHEYIYDESKFFCPHCGSVSSDFLENGAEWRHFDDDFDTTRAEYIGDESASMGSMNTYLGYNGKHNVLSRLQLWSNSNSKEQGILNKYKSIEKACNEHLSKNLIDESKLRFIALSKQRAIYGKSIVRKDNLKSVMASAVYFVCKEHDKNIDFKELAKWFGTSRKSIQATIRDLIKHKNHHETIIVNDSTRWNDILDRYCILCGLRHLKNEIRVFIDKAMKTRIITGKTPQTICASMIYIVSVIVHGYDMRKNLITKKCNIDKATISKCVNEIMENIEDLLY